MRGHGAWTAVIASLGIRHPVRTHHQLKEKYHNHSQTKDIM